MTTNETRCADLLERVRADRPRVHCITNAVAMPLSANALLAVGAHPSMTFDPEEVASFTARAAALTINIGTLDPTRREAIDLAVATAEIEGKPWTLDPVMASSSTKRLRTAQHLWARSPSVIRGNGPEIDIVTQSDAKTDQPHTAVIAATGVIDRIRDGDRNIEVHNGHALMDRVTAMGCAESAVISAFLAVEPDPFAATVAAILTFGVAGDIAGEAATGPGSFEPAFLDALYMITPETLIARARLK